MNESGQNPPPVLPYSDVPVGTNTLLNVTADGIRINVPRRRPRTFGLYCGLLAAAIIPCILIIIWLMIVAARLPARARTPVLYYTIWPGLCLILCLIWARRLLAKGRSEATVCVTSENLLITEYSGRDRRDYAWPRDEIVSIIADRAPGQWHTALQVCTTGGAVDVLLVGHDHEYLNWLIAAVKHAMLMLPSGQALNQPTARPPLEPETPLFELPSPDARRGHSDLYLLGGMALAFAVWLPFGWVWAQSYRQTGLMQAVQVSILGFLAWAFFGNLAGHVRRQRVRVSQGVLIYTISGVLRSRDLQFPAYALSDVAAASRQRPQDGVFGWWLDIVPVSAPPIRIATSFSEDEIREIVIRLRGALGMPGQ